MQQTQQHGHQEEENVCAICLDPITHDYIQPKCKHQFHYGCMHKVDMAHREQVFQECAEEDVYYPTLEDFKELFESSSISKDIIDYCDADDPLNCPLCRAPMSIRDEKILNKKKSTSLGKVVKSRQHKYIENMKCRIIKEPRRGEKYKSQKGRKNEKMTYRRFNK